MAKAAHALRKRFGARLRRLREARHLTQEQLAARAELDPKYLGAVERGQENISLDRIGSLADALSIDVSEVFHPDPPQGDASSERFLQRMGVLFRRSGTGQRRLMRQLVEDVAQAYGKKRS